MFQGAKLFYMNHYIYIKVVPVLTQPCTDSCVVIVYNSIESAQLIAKHWKDFSINAIMPRSGNVEKYYSEGIRKNVDKRKS